MTVTEINFAESLIHSVDHWNFAVTHALERMQAKRITKQDVLDTLKFGEVIEVNSLGRILLRLRAKGHGGRCGTCAVVSIRDKVLVTTWWNRENDEHAKLALGEYKWDIHVTDYLERQVAKSTKGEDNGRKH